MNFQKRVIMFLLSIFGLAALSIIAGRCRHMVGEENSSKSGKFTIFDCFDMSSGTLACSVKEGVKLYVNNFRSVHVEKVRTLAMQTALTEALTHGKAAADAAKHAQNAGDKAAKLAAKQAKRVTGPITSSGWDFFEAIYYGGTMLEGFFRGTGTLFGTYAGGFYGEQTLGRFGYLAGSHMGSWIGGRIGLMVDDVARGIYYTLQLFSSQESAAPQDSKEL